MKRNLPRRLKQKALGLLSKKINVLQNFVSKKMRSDHRLLNLLFARVTLDALMTTKFIRKMAVEQRHLFALESSANDVRESLRQPVDPSSKYSSTGPEQGGSLKFGNYASHVSQRLELFGENLQNLFKCLNG
jgi:hypothetical protein